MPQRRSSIALVAVLLIVVGCSEAPDHAGANAPAAESAPEAPADAALAQSSSDCTWIMGWDPWEPYQYMDVGNTVRGLDVELVTAAAAAVGCDLEFRRDDWLDLLDELKSGDIHLLAGATQTPDREEFAQFSIPYREETFQLFVAADDQSRYRSKSMQNLLEEGFRIGVTAGYFYGDELAALEADDAFEDQFHAVDSGVFHFTHLLNGEIDGFLEDEFVAASLIRRRGLDNEIRGPVLEVGNTPVRVMFSKAVVRPERVKAFNEALATLRNSGRHASIVSRYLSPAS